VSKKVEQINDYSLRGSRAVNYFMSYLITAKLRNSTNSCPELNDCNKTLHIIIIKKIYTHNI